MAGQGQTLPDPSKVVGETGKSIASATKEMVSSNLGLVVVVCILFIVIVYVMIYIFKQYNDTSLKTVTMVKKPIKVPSDRLLNISEDAGLPKLNYVNGKEFSYSFWIYVDGDNNQNTSYRKFILGRMESSDSVNNASPLFELDNISNKFFVKLSTSSSTSERKDSLEIKYFPLQRWVNVVLVVDNNFVQLFLDGELREVKDLSDHQQDSSIVNTPVGNLFIGSSVNKPSFNGYISKVQAFNYAVTIDHAKVIYKAGPLHKTVLSVIGIDTYGIQNPIYRIDEKDQMKENCST
jgi:hypothetical protein